MANRYWVGGSGTWNTTSTTNWSASSGGAGGASVPTAADSVFFDRTGTYTVTCTGDLKCLDITVSAGTVTFADGTSPTFTISGSMSLLAGTAWNTTGAITFNATSSGKAITTNGVYIAGNITFNGSGGTWQLGSAITTAGIIYFNAGTFTTGTNYSITALSIRIDGATVYLNGSSVYVSLAGNTFMYFSGTLATGTSKIYATASTVDFFCAGVGALYDVYFNNSNIDFVRLSCQGCTLRYVTVTKRSNPGVGEFQINGTPTSISNLSIIGGGGANCRMRIQSNQPDLFTRVLTCNSISFTDVDFRGITAAGNAAPFWGTRLGDCGGNSNIDFDPAKTVYWNLAAGGTWSSTAWATTGGGTPSINNFPLAQDTVIFQSTGLNSGTTVYVDGNYSIGTLDLSARTSNTMNLQLLTNIEIYGNWIGGSGVTMSGTGTIVFRGGTAQAFTSAGVVFVSPIKINSPSGTVTLQDNLTVSSSGAGAVSLINGTLNLNGKTLTLSSPTTATFLVAAGDSGGSRNLTFNGGTLSIATSGSAVFNNTSPTNFTTTAGTGTGKITLTSASDKTFVGGGSTFNCTLDQGGAGALTITDSNTFNDITNSYKATAPTTIKFTAGTTTTVSNFTATGSGGKLLTINSSTSGTQFTLSKSSGLVNATYLNIKDSVATGGATWKALSSVNSGNNTGWTIFSGIGNFLAFFE